MQGKPNVDTFWSKLRVARNLSIPKVSEDTGLPIGSLTTYFSGEHVPREYALRTLCYYFDVDLEEGKSEFIKDHETWNKRHSDEWHNHDKQRQSAYYKNKYANGDVYLMTIALRKNADKDIIDKLNTIEIGNRSTYLRWVLGQHLRNDNFSVERLTPAVRNLLEVIYSEVPFDIFMKMLSSLLDTKTIDAKLLYGYVSYSTFLKVYKLQNCI